MKCPPVPGWGRKARSFVMTAARALDTGKAVGAPRRTFALEAQLCEVLAACVPATLGWSRPATMLSEVQVGTVIPDLVIVDPVVDDWSLVSLTGFESWVLADLLRARARQITTLSRRLYARPEKTMRVVKRLERLGLIGRDSSSALSLCESFPRDAEVVAVEAKLYRWREAVDQATAYLRFANRSYVALPKEVVDGNDLLQAACRTRNVGVIAVSGASVEIVREAPLHQPRSPGWVWLVARAIARRRNASSTQHQAPPAKRAGVPVTSLNGTGSRRLRSRTA